MTAADDFIEAAIDHGEHIGLGLAPEANAAYDKIIMSGQAIQLDEDSGAKVFTALLFHENQSVQSWAAYFLLPSQEAMALDTLTRIGEGRGSVSFDARIAIKEWRAGRLKVI